MIQKSIAGLGTGLVGTISFTEANETARSDSPPAGFSRCARLQLFSWYPQSSLTHMFPLCSHCCPLESGSMHAQTRYH